MLAVVLIASILAVCFTSYADVTIPTEPELNSAAGVVIDASTGEVIWGKDADTAYSPASITKIMTALLVIENCKMDDMVTFSKTATTNLESGATTANMVEGDVLSVKDCLYALMIRSANEVANALAEHVSGSVEAFAELMNKRAKELGCTGTNFANPNGLNNDKHYTTAHDMALIAAAAFANDTIREIDATQKYKLPATIKNPKGLTLTSSNKIFNSAYKSTAYYPYAIASKTGYTKKAGNTLATMAEKDGVRLVAVVLKNTAYLGHYKDTIELLNYGFDMTNLKANAVGSGISSGTQAEGTVSGQVQPTLGGTGISAVNGNDETVKLIGPGSVIN